jgi:Uma2 family endonuclease
MTVTLERPALDSSDVVKIDETVSIDKTPSEELDEMFAAMEAAGTPEGYRSQIVEGQIVMSPQRDVHWNIIDLLAEDVKDLVGRRTGRILSDVRVDFPGYLNGFAPDLMLLVEGAQPLVGGNGEQRYQCRDIQLVAEVVSKSSRRTDYEIKLTTYAEASVPVYVIADPIKAMVTVYSEPADGKYQIIHTYHFGATFTIPHDKGITVDTDDWPRDEPRPAKPATTTKAATATKAAKAARPKKK